MLAGFGGRVSGGREGRPFPGGFPATTSESSHIGIESGKTTVNPWAFCAPVRGLLGVINDSTSTVDGSSLTGDNGGGRKDPGVNPMDAVVSAAGKPVGTTLSIRLAS
jgi:hypothetical protein